MNLMFSAVAMVYGFSGNFSPDEQWLNHTVSA